MSYTNFDFPHTNFYETDLRELIRLVKVLKGAVENLEGWREKHEKEYEELKDLYDNIVAGKFPDSIVKAFQKWMYENAIELVGQLIKHIYFGLTDDGYFCAFIPDNWKDVTFDTIDIADDPLYGHLVLMYD